MNKSISATTTKLTNLVLLAAMFVVITPMVLANTTTPAPPTQSTIYHWGMPGQSPLRANYVPAYLAPYAEPNQDEHPDFAVSDPNSFPHPFTFEPGGVPITAIPNVQPPVEFTDPSASPVIYEVPGEYWVNPIGAPRQKIKSSRPARPVSNNLPEPQSEPATPTYADPNLQPVNGDTPYQAPNTWWGPAKFVIAPEQWNLVGTWPTSRWYNWIPTQPSLVAYGGNSTNPTRLERYAFNGKARFKR